MQTGEAANNDLQQEQPDMGGSSPLTASVSNGTKPHVHVPPRIDPDMYQADVPDWTPPEGALPLEPSISNHGSVSSFSAGLNDSAAVRDFLTTVRNLADSTCPRSQKHWYSNQSGMPLESDVLALEYLASYEYDVEKALFNLFCDLGRGKDALITGRTVSVADRSASNVVFTDSKDRIFKAPPQMLLGAYPAMLNGSRSLLAGAPHAENGESNDLRATLMAASLTAPVEVMSDASAAESAHSLGAARNVDNVQKYALFSAIISHPIQKDVLAKLAEAAVEASAAEVRDQDAAAQKGPAAGSARKKIPANAEGAVMHAEPGAEDVGADEKAVVAGRPSKPRGASADKAELRRKWLNVAQRAAFLLGPAAFASGSGSSSGQGASSSAAGGKAGRRGSLMEAQAVVDLACSLPPYSAAAIGSGSAVINSSSAANMSTAAVAAATEEAFLLDNVSSLLGKLTKAVLAGRFLVSEVRDAVYSCSIDAIVLSHQSDIRSKGGSKKGNAESLMNGLRELLRELEGQVLCAELEEKQVRELIGSTEALLKDSRAVLRECCAWEAAINDPEPERESTAKSCPSNSVRGRPEAFSATQVKALLQHHVQLLAADGVLFEPSAVHLRPTMQEVGDLLRRAALNSVKISEMGYIAEVYRRGNLQVDEASTILVRASQLATAKARLTLDRARYSLPEVQRLLLKMHQFPFRSEEVDALQALVAKAEAWRSEVALIRGNALKPADGAELTAAASSNSRASRKADPAGGQSKPIPLKKVEALIADGERLPFELKEELEVLKEKRSQAKMWLDKLKRSFVPTKVGSSRSKKNSDESAGPVEKLSLADMKMMVSEGESLYQQPLDDDVDGSGVSAPSRSSAAPSSRMANRELDRAQAVVESAEDWISRVRDLLSGGGEEGVEDGDSAAGASTQRAGENAEVAEEDEEEEESEEDSQERTMHMLRSMLEEAEGMPVTLDESGFLRSHLHALEWAAKVRPFLNPEVPAEPNPSAEPTTAKEGKDSKDGREGKGKGRTSALPRLSELQSFARDITRIRSSMSSAAAAEFPLKPLPEEGQCLNLVAEAERWLGKVKKLLQGSAVRKGTKLARLQLLFDEGAALPVNFDAELRPIRAAISAAKQWQEDNAPMLQRLLSASGAADQKPADAFEAESAEATSVPASATAGVKEETNSAAAQEDIITLADLVNLAASAAQLVADFDSARLAQEVLAKVEGWIQRVDKVCGTTTSMPRAAGALPGADLVESAASRSAKRKKTSHEEEDPMASEGAEDAATGDAAQETVAAAVPPSSAPAARTGMLTMEQLDALVLQGRGFGLNLEDKIELLVHVKAKAEAWQREAMQYVSSQFSEGFKRIFVEYKRLITDYTASDNGAVLAFMPNRKASALTPSNQAKAAREEAALSSKAQALLAEVLQVRAVAETIGVETPFYHTILVFIRILEWVEEARAAACLQSTSRRPAPQRPGAAGRSGSSARHALSSWRGWEDVRVATRLKNWGDMDEELVLTLVREGGAMLKHLYPLEADEKLPGMLAHYAKGILAPAADFQDPADMRDAEDGEVAEESGGEEEDGSQGDADVAMVEGENEEETSSGKKRRQSASSSARKKKRVEGADDIASPAGKATRGAYGISKKRVDSDFAETVNLNTLNAGGVSSISDKEKAQKNKRQRGALGAEDGEASVAAVAEPEVELDLAKTARRAGLDAYFESEATQKVRLAPAMAYMLDLWLRVLQILAMRLRVANRWVGDAQRLLHVVGALGEGGEGEDAPAVVKGAHTGEDAESLLSVAVQEGIQSKHRTLLEATVQESKDWLKRAADMRTSTSALLTMDELKNFLKAGEKVIYVQQRNAELQDLRNELKRARQWKLRLEKSGFEAGTAPAELLTELVDEAKTIRVNLGEFTDSIVQVNKTYCLCRQAYHGQMVGCDTCEEWYHFQCVGLSFSQAEKCAKYVCVRCALKNSFSQSANMVAQLTNKWMNCVEHFRRRDEVYQKACKKVYKEEKELVKARVTFKTLVDALPQPAAAHPAPEEGAPEGAVPAGAPPLSAADAEKVGLAKRDVDHLEVSVAKALQEKEALARAISLETQLHKEVFRWMQAMQELLWPCTDEQVALGKPLGPSAAAPLQASSFLEYNRALLAHLPSLLPVGLQHMERAAALVGIRHLDDVATVLEAFRWMSWTNLCLHMLRLPPTTPALRTLLDACKDMRYTDEKVVKMLTGVLQRASAWKGKARKTLTAQQKKLDLARLQALALEGNTLPLTSRIKDKLKGIISGHPVGAADADGASSASGAAEASGKGGKRGSKPNQLLGGEATASGAVVAAAAGWSSEVWASRIHASGVEDCASSDEEDQSEKLQASAAPEPTMLQRALYAHGYPSVDPQALAAIPDTVWPQQLLVARRRPPSAPVPGQGRAIMGGPASAGEEASAHQGSEAV